MDEKVATTPWLSTGLDVNDGEFKDLHLLAQMAHDSMMLLGLSLSGLVLVLFGVGLSTQPRLP